MPTLENALDQFAELLRTNRMLDFAIGDYIAECVTMFGRGCLGKLAEVAACSKEYLLQRIRLSMAFPSELRFPDVPFSLYRAAYNAAKRLNKEPVAVLKEALKHEWSAGDLNAVGKEQDDKARLSTTCQWCNSKVTVLADGGLAGTEVRCPVCQDDGQERLLGVLSNN